MKWIIGLLALGVGGFVLFGTLSASSYEMPDPVRIEVSPPPAPAVPRASDARIVPAVFRTAESGAAMAGDPAGPQIQGLQQQEAQIYLEEFSRRGPIHHRTLKAKSIN